MPQLKLRMRVAKKYLKDNKGNILHWALKICSDIFLEHYQFLEAHHFAPNGEYCLFILLLQQLSIPLPRTVFRIHPTPQKNAKLLAYKNPLPNFKSPSSGCTVDISLNHALFVVFLFYPLHFLVDVLRMSHSLAASPFKVQGSFYFIS